MNTWNHVESGQIHLNLFPVLCQSQQSFGIKHVHISMHFKEI